MTIEERRQSLEVMRERHHRACLICGDCNPEGLGITFDVCRGGGVEAEVVCGEHREGYADHLHGGMIASLLDGAMTNCLFSHGIAAVTGELTVRVLLPVEAVTLVRIYAWVDESSPPLYRLKSELRQHGRLKARGRAKFVQKWSEAAQVATGQ